MTATLPPSARAFPLVGYANELNELKLSDVIRTIPKSCFEKDWRKAWLAVLLTLLSVAVGIVAIALSPWYLLPAAWFFYRHRRDWIVCHWSRLRSSLVC